jgi:hypothetical protein
VSCSRLNWLICAQTFFSSLPPPDQFVQLEGKQMSARESVAIRLEFWSESDETRFGVADVVVASLQSIGINWQRFFFTHAQ